MKETKKSTEGDFSIDREASGEALVEGKVFCDRARRESRQGKTIQKPLTVQGCREMGALFCEMGVESWTFWTPPLEVTDINVPREVYCGYQAAYKKKYGNYAEKAGDDTITVKTYEVTPEVVKGKDLFTKGWDWLKTYFGDFSKKDFLLYPLGGVLISIFIIVMIYLYSHSIEVEPVEREEFEKTQKWILQIDKRLEKLEKENKNE